MLEREFSWRVCRRWLRNIENDPKDCCSSEVPSSATNEYGRPFEQILEEADWDFYAIDDDVFAPADITIDVVGGPTYSFGEPNESILQESFEL